MTHKEANNDRHVSQRGQKALVLLSLLLLIAIVVPSLLLRNKGSVSTEENALAAKNFQIEVAHFSDSLAQLQQHNDSLRKIRYATQRRTPASTKQGAKENRTHADDEVYPRAYVKKTLMFELNSADTLDLQQLHGIGPVFARRIVGYRTKLGGYVSVAQLREVYGLEEETYQIVAPHLTVDTTLVTKLNPNTSTLQELKRHPYLDYYQARAIVDYRESGHNYTKADDLLLVNLITDSVLLPLRPYLTF